MHFEFSGKVKDLERRLTAFMDEHVYPNEPTFRRQIDDGDRWEPTKIVEELKGAGYRMGLVSNLTLRADLMRADLDRWSLTRFLDATVFSSEVGVRKPDPRIFKEALNRIRADPGETAFVGDRLYDDVSGAQAVGMRGILTRQFRQEADPAYHPDAVIEHLKELPSVLSKWNDRG